MRNFFENLVKTISFSDDGFIGLIHGVYLLITQKLPDSVESNLPSHKRKTFIIVQTIYYILVSALLISFGICVVHFENIQLVIFIHIILYFLLLIITSFIKTKLYK